MVEVKPLVVLTIYQNDMLPEIYSEVYSKVADEYATDANVYNWMIGDDLAGLIGIDQDSYEDIVEQTVNESYSIAWENIQYIVKNNISEADFPMGDIDDENAGAFIGYYFKTIEDVDARIMLSEPVLLKDEAKYATKRHLKISYQKMMKKIMSKSDNKIEGQNLQNIHLRKNKTYFFLRITASIAINNSIKFSLTGLLIDWIIATSRPLTDILGVIKISPSANFWISIGDNFTFKWSATFCANLYEAFKENIIVFCFIKVINNIRLL